MPNAVRVVISGYYGYQNTGDEAILGVLLEQLRTYFPQLQVQVISGAPEETASAYGVEAILWSDPLAIAHAIAEADFVITGGGGIFHDYGGFQEYGLLTEGNWGLSFHVTAGLLAAVFRKPHFLYSVGVGPIFSEQGRSFVRAICDSAALISVRDEGSAQLLAELGVAPAQIHVTADPAFLLKPACEARLQEIFEREGVPASNNRLVVVLRHWDQGVDPNHWEPQVADALRAIRDRHQAQILFVPFQTLPGQQEDDRAVARRFKAAVGGRNVFLLEGRYAPAELAAVLRSAKSVLGMRLHAVILSLVVGRPFVALLYDRKVEDVVLRAGKPRWGIRFEELSRNQLIERLEASFSEAPADANRFKLLAAETIQLVRQGFANGVKPLPETTLALWRNATLSLLRSNAELRTGIREQKMNYEYQVRVQQQRIEDLQAQIPESTSWKALLEEREALKKECEERQRNLDGLARELEGEKARGQILAVEIEQLRQNQQMLQKLHRDTVQDWETYYENLNRCLALYRNQKPWRVMLALRKGYLVFVRRGCLPAIRWGISLLLGRGEIETEQLEFPARPKPREITRI
ncbi:MAG: polysaccharide pyruvyl transferase family protein [Bryobacteraceae bacterium]|nr:polysaccharide pyruvyl transferase family protein [Bryobacteraceae bacterium]MDW8378512.1 polysaccharide pyruvyl transferase family protein [Bryobacterales bacterium]